MISIIFATLDLEDVPFHPCSDSVTLAPIVVESLGCGPFDPSIISINHDYPEAKVLGGNDASGLYHLDTTLVNYTITVGTCF